MSSPWRIGCKTKRLFESVMDGQLSKKCPTPVEVVTWASTFHTYKLLLHENAHLAALKHCSISRRQPQPRGVTYAVKTRVYLVQEFFSPSVEASEGLLIRDVEHQNARICATIKRYAQRLKPLLPRSIPDLASGNRMHTHTRTILQRSGTGSIIRSSNIIVHRKTAPLV